MKEIVYDKEYPKSTTGRTGQSGGRDMCPFCKSEILPGQTTFPKEYCCGTLLYKNGHTHQVALCAAWEELTKLRAVAEALRNYVVSRCAVGPGSEENRQILLSIAIERLEGAGYLK